MSNETKKDKVRVTNDYGHCNLCNGGRRFLWRWHSCWKCGVKKWLEYSRYDYFEGVLCDECGIPMSTDYITVIIDFVTFWLGLFLVGVFLFSNM